MDFHGSTQFKIYNSIKELMLNSEPFIRAMGYSDKTVEEVLKHLHNYNECSSSDSSKLKKIILYQIRFHLDEIINAEAKFLAQSSVGLSPEEFQKIKNECIERISQTDAYTNIWYFLKQCVEKSTHVLVGNFDTELDPVLLMKDESRLWSYSYQQSGTSLSDPDSLEMSTGNYYDFTLLKSECFQNLVNNLNSLKPLEIRIKTLQLLCNIPSTELLTDYQLRDLMSGLKDALVSSNKTLFQLSLQFHAKMMGSTSPHVVKEMFVNLVAFLKNEFLLKKSIEFLPNSDSGIDLRNNYHQKILLIFRLLVECHKKLIKHWVRYPEIQIKVLIVKAIELLSLKPKMKSTFTPLQYFALLDAEANWLHLWLRRSLSRAVLVTSLGKHKEWLSLITKKCLQYLQKEAINKTNDKLTSQTDVYSSEMMNHIAYFNIIKLLHALLKYSHTRKILMSFQKSCNIEQIFLAFANSFSFCKCHDENKCDRYCIANAITDTLIDFIQTESACNSLMLNIQFMQVLISPLLSFINSDLPKATFKKSSIKFVISILEAYNKNHVSKSFLQKLNVHETVIEFATYFLKVYSTADDCHETVDLKFKVINLCCALNSNLGVILSCPKMSCFLESLTSAWLSDGSQHETTRNTELMATKSSSSSYDYLNYLQSFAFTPMGCFKLQKLNILEDCLFYLVNKIMETSATLRNWEESVVLILNQSSFFTKGILALDSSGLVTYLVQDLWTVCESNVSYVSPVFITYLMDSNEQLILDTINRLLGLVGSFTAVTVLLNAAAAIPYLPTPPPKALKDFFSLTVFRDTSSTLKELTNAEHLSLTALYVLSGIVSSLDSSLFLQTQYGYQDVLIQSQIDSQNKENGSFIRDALSEERNYILVKTLSVGGPSEKKLPSQVWETEIINDSLPLFGSRILPKEYQTFHQTTTKDENNTKIEKLLHVTIDDENAHDWQKQCYNLFIEMIGNCSALDSVLLKLLEKWFCFVCKNVNDDIEQANKCSKLEIPKQYISGIELTLTYGFNLGLLTKKNNVQVQLENTLKFYLKNLFPNEHLKDLDKLGFPWLVASIFLMAQGDEERCTAFLNKLYHVSDCSKFYHADRNALLDDVSWPLLIHCLELMLSLECSAVWSVFKLNSLALSPIVKLWIQQCFWNFLDWNEIIQFIFLSFLRGPIAIIFYVISIFKHLEKDILRQAQVGQLMIFFLEMPLHKYQLSNYIHFILDLSQKYHTQLAEFFPE